MDKMKRIGGPTKNQTVPDEWASPGRRVNWLLDKKFIGNRSTMARRLGFAPSTLSRVVTGEKPPGRRLLTAIVEHLGVDSKWLLTGEGEPFVRTITSGGWETVAPVADKLLPGAPQDHRELLTPESFDTTTLLGPSQYWYRLTRDDPIVNDTRRGFRSGDLLLLETDRTRFPKSENLNNNICVITFMIDGRSTRKLGSVTEFGGSIDDGPARLEADTFDLPMDTQRIVKEYIIQEYPNKEPRLFTRNMRLAEVRGREVLEPLTHSDNLFTSAQMINYDDIVSIWTGILYRERQS